MPWSHGCIRQPRLGRVPSPNPDVTRSQFPAPRATSAPWLQRGNFLRVAMNTGEDFTKTSLWPSSPAPTSSTPPWQSPPRNWHLFRSSPMRPRLHVLVITSKSAPEGCQRLVSFDVECLDWTPCLPEGVFCRSSRRLLTRHVDPSPHWYHHSSIIILLWSGHLSACSGLKLLCIDALLSI